MRKSQMPSLLKLPPAERALVTSGASTSRRDPALIRRASAASFLYSEDDMSDALRAKLTDAYKPPQQDSTKMQQFDPSRSRCTLGPSRVKGSRPERVVPISLPIVGSDAAPEDDFEFEPLRLWEPPPLEEEENGEAGEAGEAGEEAAGEEGGGAAAAAEAKPAKPDNRPPPIEVDGILCKFLRPHQREGVQFTFDCCMGMRDYEGEGCILADDMGLGKTLQSITILWTLMCQGLDGKPAVRHTIVACPVSLVTNWEKELTEKWIGASRLRQRGIDVIAVSEAAKSEVKRMVNRFTSSRTAVLIISYETFRIHEKLFHRGKNQCGLLICDEAHRLKNKDTKTAKALHALPTRKRILLSGTPIQNDLDEFYSMVHFCNPDLLGSEKHFHRVYQNPILRAREPDATPRDRDEGEKKSGELGRIVNQFILRRTNTLLSNHLPPKLVCVVCCSMSSLQTQMYTTFLSSKLARTAANGGKQTMVLAAITARRSSHELGWVRLGVRLESGLGLGLGSGSGSGLRLGSGFGFGLELGLAKLSLPHEPKR